MRRCRSQTVPAGLRVAGPVSVGPPPTVAAPADISNMPKALRARLAAELPTVAPDGIDLFFDDASYDPPGAAAGGAVTGELRAPFNGKVIAVKASVGDKVARGDTLLVMESMKLEHALAAPQSGAVKAVMVEAGQQASTSQVLVTFEPA